VETTHVVAVGDGLGFEAPEPTSAATVGGTVQTVRPVWTRHGTRRQVVSMRLSNVRSRVPEGWRVVRTSDATLLRVAQESFANVAVPERVGARRLDVRVFGHAGGPLKTIWNAGELEVTVRGEVPLSVASKRSLDVPQLREQLGRLGGTAFKLGTVDVAGLADGLFLPVSELNRIRQDAVAQLDEQLGWARQSDVAVREARISEVVERIASSISAAVADTAFALRAIVCDVDTAREAAAGGATDIVLDPFLRHPTPPLARVNALREELAAAGVTLRLRTPTIVRPEERKRLDKWLALELPLLTGHLGLLAEFGGAGRDVIADYATNVFNQHTAELLFELGASRLVASIELTTEELGQLSDPWRGRGFDVLVYGRTEGMTIEHCVLSAAFDREPTTCRDLCVQKHTNVSLTDPAGYTFAVATDSACRNRLLHSRPIDGSEYLPDLWAQGIRGYQMVFNVPGDPVQQLVRAYREILGGLAGNVLPDLTATRRLLDGAFTRGHFARAV
jgi:putative protease